MDALPRMAKTSSARRWCELVKQVKIYPLSKAANPPAQRLLDMTDVMFNGLVK